MSSDKKRKLPEGWKWEKLMEICDTQSGGTPSRRVKEYYTGTIPWVKSGELKDGFIYKTEEYITEEAIENSSAKIIPAETLLIALYGATVGKLGILKIDASTNQAICAISCGEKVNNKYLFYYLLHERKKLLEISFGGAQPNISQDIIKYREIPFPTTLADQLAIASDLERRMAHVEKMRAAALRQKEAIAAMQGAILREVFPCEEGDELPEGRRWKQLNDVCFVNPPRRKGFTREPDELTSFVPMESINEETGKISHIIEKGYSEISNGYTFFEEDDILFAKITPCMQNGKSAIAQDLIDGVGFGSTEFHVLRPKKDITKEWIYFYVRTAEFRNRAKDHFEGSAGQQRVSTYYIENSLIPLPPTLSDQITFAAELERKMSKLEKARQAAERQLEAIEALPGAILREVFDFEDGNTDS